jgi:hypothetical protein
MATDMRKVGKWFVRAIISAPANNPRVAPSLQRVNCRSSGREEHITGSGSTWAVSAALIMREQCDHRVYWEKGTEC